MADGVITGLTEIEAAARRERGLANVVRFDAGRTYLQILRKNAFTFINTVLFAIGIVLVLMGQTGDAVVTAGLVLLNVIVGVYQESRAKRKLEHIALLTRPRATVLRDGTERGVDPDEIVLGDVLAAGPGDQIVVDGEVIGDGSLQVDESLLTGESERIRKRAGDRVYSGTFCVAGGAFYRAEQVGADSVANRLTSGARAFRQVKTPLQRDIEGIIRVLVVLVTQVGILLAISFALKDVPAVEWVRVAAVIVAMVPQGLFFMSTVAYALGALRVAGQGALIQEANAVESTSHVDLLCLDKTGTLTTNRLELDEMVPLGSEPGQDSGEMARLLGTFAASVTDGDETTAAIATATGAQSVAVAGEIPFSSETKWSALSFADPGLSGDTYVLGAPEALWPSLPDASPAAEQAETRAAQGRRVLLFARYPGALADRVGDDAPALPQRLDPLMLVSLRHELRPHARETLHHLADLGIRMKLISGDHPETVMALARQVGLGDDIRGVSGLDARLGDPAQIGSLADETTVFGRVTPQQKESLVDLFHAQGHYVAMVGDGVNDVLSLKRAQVGIAMQSGSPATRSVADIVLLGDSFAALPRAFREGQRIVRGMEDVVRLLLTRTFYLLLLIVATQMVGVPFPVTPKHNSILALVTVGIPILAIAAWARPGPSPESVIRSASRYIFPAAFTISILALGVYLGYLKTSGDLAVARTALTTVTVLCGLLLIPFAEPPSPAWVGGDVLSGDRRPTILAAGMLVLFYVIMAVPALRGFFELTPLPLLDHLLLAGVVAVWAVFLRYVWRTRLLERVLGWPVDSGSKS